MSGTQIDEVINTPLTCVYHTQNVVRGVALIAQLVKRRRILIPQPPMALCTVAAREELYSVGERACTTLEGPFQTILCSSRDMTYHILEVLTIL